MSDTDALLSQALLQTKDLLIVLQQRTAEQSIATAMLQRDLAQAQKEVELLRRIVYEPGTQPTLVMQTAQLREDFDKRQKLRWMLGAAMIPGLMAGLTLGWRLLASLYKFP